MYYLKRNESSFVFWNIHNCWIFNDTNVFSHIPLHEGWEYIKLSSLREDEEIGKKNETVETTIRLRAREWRKAGKFLETLCKWQLLIKTTIKLSLQLQAILFNFAVEKFREVKY